MKDENRRRTKGPPRMRRWWRYVGGGSSISISSVRYYGYGIILGRADVVHRIGWWW